MGKLRKIGKKIKKRFKKIGKKLKKGFGKFARAFGKLGPLGSIALSFLLPGIGSVLSGWLGQMGPVGKFILDIGSKIQQGANWVKDGVGRVFNRVTDAIEYGMNSVSKTGTAGSSFRNWVSEQTKGFIDPSKQGVEDIKVPGQDKIIKASDDFTSGEIKVTDTSSSNEITQGAKDSVAAMDKRIEEINAEKTTIGADTNVKTTKAETKGYFDFDKGKENYAYIKPITKAGGKILEDESDAAYADYLMKSNNAARARAIAEETLSMVPTNTYTYAPQNFIDMNSLDNNPNSMVQMTSGYGLILEDFYAT